MTWFGYSLVALSLMVFTFAWLKGGHPERLGVTLFSVAYVATVVFPRTLVLGDMLLFDAIGDVILLAILLWMALRSDRWWPFVAAAAMILTVVVHAAMIVVPELDTRADMSARMGLTLLMVLALLAGVGERWLAGERAVSASAVWRRTRPET